MVDSDSHDTPNMYPKLNADSLNDQQKFRLNKINEIKGYFVGEIKESKRINEQNI